MGRGVKDDLGGAAWPRSVRATSSTAGPVVVGLIKVAVSSPEATMRRPPSGRPSHPVNGSVDHSLRQARIAARAPEAIESFWETTASMRRPSVDLRRNQDVTAASALPAVQSPRRAVLISMPDSRSPVTRPSCRRVAVVESMGPWMTRTPPPFGSSARTWRAWIVPISSSSTATDTTGTFGCWARRAARYSVLHCCTTQPIPALTALRATRSIPSELTASTRRAAGRRSSGA